MIHRRLLKAMPMQQVMANIEVTRMANMMPTSKIHSTLRPIFENACQVQTRAKFVHFFRRNTSSGTGREKEQSPRTKPEKWCTHKFAAVKREFELVTRQF